MAILLAEDIGVPFDTPAPSDLEKVFGKISPPQGLPGSGGDTAPVILQNLFATGIKLFIFLASFALLAFLLWGALDWILSGGEKEKIAKAQSKITNAIIGFLLIFIVLGLFGVITGDILGIIKKGPDGGWGLALPTLGN